MARVPELPLEENLATSWRQGGGKGDVTQACVARITHPTREVRVNPKTSSGVFRKKHYPSTGIAKLTGFMPGAAGGPLVITREEQV